MVVALKGGKHQGYCSGAGGETSCLSTRIGNLEKFHVVPAAKGFIGLKGGDKACKSGKGTVEACHEGVTITVDGDSQVNYFHSGHMNLMQKFKVFNAGPNKVALMSKESGKFCSDNGQHIECAASDITPDEKFQVKCLSGCGDESDLLVFSDHFLSFSAFHCSGSSNETGDKGIVKRESVKNRASCQRR